MLFLVIVAFKVCLEYEYYVIGLTPSAFYSSLENPENLKSIVKNLLVHVIFISFLKGITSVFSGLFRVRLQASYTRKCLQACFHSLSTCFPKDLEQRLLDDCKKRAELEIQLVDKILLPLMVAFYTIECFQTVPYKFALILIYTYAFLCCAVLKVPIHYISRLTGELAENDGIIKSKLCWVTEHKDAVLLSDGHEWHLEKIFAYFAKCLHTQIKLGQAEAVLEAIRSGVSYSGAAINYLIILLYIITRSDSVVVSAGTVSKHSFLCMMLISKLDECFSILEVYYKRKVHCDRIADVLDACAPHAMHSSSDNIVLKGRCLFHWKIDLDTSSHRINWIVGPNGCGKSTLVRILKLENPSADAFVIPQGPFILAEADSWESIIAYPQSKAVLEIAGILRIAGLSIHDPLPRTPGQWQRVHLARLIYHAPRLAVLDEPFSCLDSYRDLLLSILSHHLPNTKFILLTPCLPPSTLATPCNLIILPAKSDGSPSPSTQPPRSSAPPPG